MSIRKIKRQHMRAMNCPLERITFAGEGWDYLRSLPNDAARADFVRTALRQYIRSRYAR